jgi:hypothetical protein
MNWKSVTTANGGNLSNEMVSMLPGVMHSFLSEMESKRSGRFTLSELANHISLKFPDIEPIFSKMSKGSAEKKFPGKRILDIQNSCYHFARDKNYWIEDKDTGERVTLLEHPEHHKGQSIEDVIYKILPNWQDFWY